MCQSVEENYLELVKIDGKQDGNRQRLHAEIMKKYYMYFAETCPDWGKKSGIHSDSCTLSCFFRFEGMPEYYEKCMELSGIDKSYGEEFIRAAKKNIPNLLNDSSKP